MKEFFTKEYQLTKLQKLMQVMMVFVLGGVFGFAYEELFYRVDLGYWVKRGSTYGPWIPIYAVGALLLIFLVYRLRKRPYLVLLVGAGVTGILEFTAGYCLYHFAGKRLWDYNQEIWNWGNIGGYVCFRSVAFFAVSGFLLTYFFVPIINHVVTHGKKWVVLTLSAVLSLGFLADMIIYALLH